VTENFTCSVVSSYLPATVITNSYLNQDTLMTCQ